MCPSVDSVTENIFHFNFDTLTILLRCVLLVSICDGFWRPSTKRPATRYNSLLLIVINYYFRSASGVRPLFGPAQFC